MRTLVLPACSSMLLLLSLALPVQAQDDLDALFSDDAEESFGKEEDGDGDGEEQASDGDRGSDAARASTSDASESSEPDGDRDVIPVAEEEKRPEATRARPTNRLVEEIVVTAQKREENLQDVPISVQAFSAEKLEAMGVTNQDDIQKLVPSLNISKLLSFTTIYLRGIGTDAFLTADPSVATYIDGIYFPFAIGLAQDFGVLERIEVLKGPQGTIFGRNATGGALNIVTKDPELGSFNGQANVTVASYPDLHTKAFLNVPIGDNFAFSISPIYARTSHYIDNVNENQRKPLEDDVSKGVRVKFRWAPTDWFDLTVAALDIELEAPSQGVFPVSTFTALGRLLGAPRNGYEQGSDEASLDGCCDNAADNRVFYGSAKFFTPYFDIKLLGSDQFITTRTLIDFDGSERGIATFFIDDYASDIQTAELQFLSNQSSWGSSWMKWIAGIYYFQGRAGFLDPENTQFEAIFFPPLFDAIFAPVQGLTNNLNLLGLDNLLDPFAGSPGQPPVGNLFATFLVETKSQAAFLQSTFTLTNWLDLTLGVRYQDESREMLDSRLGAMVLGEQVTLIDRNSAQKQDGTTIGPFSSEQTWSPKISLEMRPFENDTLVYLNYQEATKSGTYNGLAVLGPATFADPEKVSAWELGAKAKLFYGTLQLNGALFYYDLEDLQVQFVSLTTGGSVAFENAEAGEIRGLDFDFLWVVAPQLIEGLVVTGGLGWLETAEYTSYPDARAYTDNSGIARSGVDLSGNRIVKTPEISGNIAIAKSWNLGSGQLELAGNMYYTDEFFNEPSNRELTVQPAYNLFGAHVSYLYQPWDLRVSVFGQNLTDKFHTRGIQPTDFGDQQNIGTPRTYGMRVAWHF